MILVRAAWRPLVELKELDDLDVAVCPDVGVRECVDVEVGQLTSARFVGCVLMARARDSSVSGLPGSMVRRP